MGTHLLTVSTLRASCRRWPEDAHVLLDANGLADVHLVHVVVVLDLALGLGVVVGLDIVLDLALGLERTSAAFLTH
jgi:hypothetical protein